MQRSLLVVGVVVLAAAGLACGGAGDAPSVSGGPPAAPIAGTIVSAAPSATEMLFALGAGDRVVGVTDYCLHPAAAQALPRIGGFMTPSLERIFARRPAAVVYFPSIVRDPAAFAAGLRHAGIAPVGVEIGNVAAVRAAVSQLAAAFGVAERAAAVVARLDAELAAARAEFAGRPRRRVLVALSEELDQCYVAGAGTFVDELLEAAGAENAAGGQSGYYVISPESLLAGDPDVVIDASRVHADPRDAGERARAAWGRLTALRAVREGRVRACADDAAIQPGLRLAQGVRTLGRLIHGEPPR